MNTKKSDIFFQKGFTLVEMLVSVAVFSVIMVSAVGIILLILNTNNHARSNSIAMGNVDAVLGKIFREASVGSYYHCGLGGDIEKARNCPGGEPLSAFIFEEAGGDDKVSNDQIVYRLNQIDSSVEMSLNGGENFERITEGNIIVDQFNVNVLGNNDDTKQPAVFIGMRGYIKDSKNVKTDFAVQTMIAERLDPSILRQP